MNRKYFERDCSHLKKTPFSIFTDQAGYFPGSVKKAVIPFECDSFELTDMNGETVYTGKTEPFGFDEASGDTVCTADLSGFTKEGEYRVRAGDKLSASFRIGEDVYDKVLHDTAKAFYYLRCGCGLDERYAGQFRHGRCHCSPAVLWDDPRVTLDVSGGWHDAGDYGRYVTAGACAAGHLLYAFKLFPENLGGLTLGIPGSGMPDILREIRYELDWMLKMQRADGAVYHKVTTALHAPFIMPEKDDEQLFVFHISTMAAADLAAVAALASSIYRPFDAAFADKLAQASLRAVDWLEDNPEFIGFDNPKGCNTGGYGERDADSNLFWAYAELYSLTGEERFHKAMLEAADKGFPLIAFGYGELGGMGVLAYLLCDREKDAAAVSRFKKALSHKAEELKRYAGSCGYGVAMGPRDYCWGSNMNVMKNGMVFAVNGIINGDPDSRRFAEAQLHYLLGTNALGISYVTGNGEFPCNYPHLRPAFADGIEECMPGMVAGGANGRPADPWACQVIPEGTPPMKCFADDASSYSLNEITIYWNSPAVFVLAYLTEKK